MAGFSARFSAPLCSSLVGGMSDSAAGSRGTSPDRCRDEFSHGKLMDERE